MKQRITLAICLLSICWNLQAQKDTEFWFSAPEISADHGDQPIQLRFSAFDQAASVRVSLPADPTFVPLTVQIPANQTRSIELTNYKEILENKPSNTIHKKGILIESTTSIGAYYEVNASNNPERFLLKGANALGKHFYIPSQYGFLNQLGSESFEIVATRDNTKITITTTKPVQGHSANTPFVINLNRGESFSVRAAGTQAYDHLNGSYIESDKPIAVLSSDDSIRTGNGWDLVGDQLVPVELTGTEYIAVRGFANANAERIYITATEPGTQVYINGNIWPGPALAAGKSLEITLTGPSTFIRATKPVYVFHLSGINDEAGGALLPPLNCTGASQVGFAQGFGTNSLMILTQNGNQAFFVLNGDSTAIDASDFSVVPGTSGEWVAARFAANAFLNGNTNVLLNTEGLFHLGILNTTGPGAAYGYFSQFNSLYFGGEVSVCRGDTAVLDAGPERRSILWSTGSTERYLRVTEPGIYWATVTFQTCTATDTVIVEVIDVPLDLGPDTSFCSADSFVLVAGLTRGRYVWQDGTARREYKVKQAGTYSVAFTQDGCTVHDTVVLTTRPTPTPSLGPDTALCRWQNYILDATTSGATYLWQDGSTDARTRVQEAGRYWVTVTDEGCIATDTMRNRAVFEFLDLGPDTLLCQGEVLDYDLFFPDTEYLWHDNSISPQYLVDAPGTYFVRVDNGCQTFRDTVDVTYSDCGCAVHVASAFSPNGDGTNEQFGAIYHCPVTAFELRIYNRWGEEMFATTSPDESWDGTWRGNACLPGVYVWYMHYEGSLMRRPWREFKQGTVTLLR